MGWYILVALLALVLIGALVNNDRYPYKCTSPNGGSCVCTALDSLDCD